eukprot:SM000167S02983  [mRNA]  locus=s167:208575:209167:- [translate_table: standard]
MVVMQVGKEDAIDLIVEHFAFAPSLHELMVAADLVISHAGSGSIFEALRAGKRLLVVVNEALMDNHQRELADELAARGHCACASPATLVEALEAMDDAVLQPYPPAEAGNYAAAIDHFLGF